MTGFAEVRCGRRRRAGAPQLVSAGAFSAPREGCSFTRGGQTRGLNSASQTNRAAPANVYKFEYIHFVPTRRAAPQQGAARAWAPPTAGCTANLRAAVLRPPRLMAGGARRLAPGGRQGSWRPRFSAGPSLPPRPSRRRPLDWRATCVHTRNRANSARRSPDLMQCGGQWAHTVARRRQACAEERDRGRAAHGAAAAAAERGGERRRAGSGGEGSHGGRAGGATRRGTVDWLWGASSRPRGLLASGGCVAPARPRGVVGARGRAV